MNLKHPAKKYGSSTCFRDETEGGEAPPATGPGFENVFPAPPNSRSRLDFYSGTLPFAIGALATLRKGR